MKRFNYIPAPAMFDLHNACAIIAQAYPDSGVFLVGSSIQRRDFRDVDVRCMLADEMFDAMFPNAPDGPSHWNARWSLLCVRLGRPAATSKTLNGLPGASAIPTGKRSGSRRFVRPP